MGNRLQCCSVIPSHKSGRLSHTLIAEHRRWLETVVQLLRKWRIWVQVLAESEERGGGLLGVSDVTPAVWICGLWPLWKREMQESLHYVHIQPLCLLTLLPLRWKKAWSHQHLKRWDFGANPVNSYRTAVKSHMFEVNLGKSLAGWPTHCWAIAFWGDEELQSPDCCLHHPVKNCSKNCSTNSSHKSHGTNVFWINDVNELSEFANWPFAILLALRALFS